MSNNTPLFYGNAIKSTLISIYKKLTKYDKSLGIIENGVDNLYPERVDRFVNNSVTAKTCAKIMASYVSGGGWGAENDKIIVNKELGLTLQKFTSKLSKSSTKQDGIFIHVDYNANFKPSAYKVLPYVQCRLGKKDDNKYNGKIGVCEDWEKAKKDDITFIDVFNPKEEVVEQQIKRCKGETLLDKVKTYKGQIWYVNFDEDYTYALSQIDAVMNDCDSEAQASVYKNRSLRKGFFGKTLVVTKPLAGSLEDYPDPTLYHQAESERQNFKETIQSFLGAENNSGALHLEMSSEDLEDGLEKSIMFKDIQSNINDKLFEYTESSTFKNILMAFNSIPPALVRPENSVFSASGDSIKAMQKVYQNNTKAERNEIEQIVQYLMSIFYQPVENLTLLPLIEEENVIINNENGL